MRRKLLLMAGLAVSGSSLCAQAPRKAPASPALNSAAAWTPWLGCWQPTANANAQGSPLTCIVPAKGLVGVERIAVTGDSIGERELLVADGAPHSSSEDGCQGGQIVTWSANATRVYFDGDFTCPGDQKVRSSALWSVAPGGDWIEEEQLRSGGGEVTRETRYRDAGLPASLPVSIKNALQKRS